MGGVMLIGQLGQAHLPACLAIHATSASVPIRHVLPPLAFLTMPPA